MEMKLIPASLILWKRLSFVDAVLTKKLALCSVKKVFVKWMDKLVN